MSERKPNTTEVNQRRMHVSPGVGHINTYELSELEMIELIAIVGNESKDPDSGEVLEHRPLTQLLVRELGTVEDLDNLSVTITIERRVPSNGAS